MNLRFIVPFCIIVSIMCTNILMQETVSAPPKFGDRIGKLKRNFKVSTIIPATPKVVTTISPHVDYDFKNDIHRSDDYFASDDHVNKNFFVLKKSDEKKVHEKIDEINMLANSTQPLNKTFQLQSPSSSLVQARLEMVTDFFDVPPSPLSSVYSTPSRPTSLSKAHGVVLAAKKFVYPTNSTLRQYIAVETVGLRQDGWVIPVLVLAGLTMFMMGAFEIFVLCKTRRTSPNRRHLFLGQMLLLGLFTCSGLSALLAARPTTLSCAFLRFGTGVSFAIVFASLLVKCIFLISLNGGVYLPAIYQGLLLLFAVLIQITINVQWLLNRPAGIIFFREMSQTNRQIFTVENLNAMKDSLQLCKTSFKELRVSLIYIDFLIIIVAILAIKSRGIRDNYREATYIGLAIALVIPIWLGFTLVGLAVNQQYQDSVLAFALLATPTIVFLVMFMPKGRQLAAMGREDIYMEDREERFSASSRAGSGYSPSFFHFKPIKYGVMSGKSGASKQQQQQQVVSDDYALKAYYTPHFNLSYHHHNLPNPNYTEQTPIYYYLHKPPPPNYAGLFLQDDVAAAAYSTLEQTQHSSNNPNVYFQRSNIQHPGMIY